MKIKVAAVLILLPGSYLALKDGISASSDFIRSA